MNILAFGPNGSGKGTQGAIVKEKYGLDHIESGAIFREHIKGGTELGMKAKAFIDSGDLVPDEITIPMVLETLSNSKEKGWLLDGPPVLGLADALVIANLAEATIVTVQAGVTHKANLLDSLKRLESAKANLLGSVLTRLSRAINPEYNQKYYAYATSQNVKRTAKVRSL